MILRLRGHELDLARPVLMGIVNATPDSFSDSQRPKGVEELISRARELIAEGARIIDVGGESGRTDTLVVPPEEEAARVLPVVKGLAAEGTIVSVDTWRAPVARAVLDAGAAMINDVSGLSDPEMAAVCAAQDAGLVLTHTRVPPKTKAYPAYEDVVEEVLAFLAARVEDALVAGLPRDRLVVDPGLDLAKAPAESVELLRALPRVAGLGLPILLAASRKDFVGALTGRPPAARDPGTLAALAAGVSGGASLLRVHDVAGARDFLRVRAALDGGAGDPDPQLALADDLRREAV